MIKIAHEAPLSIFWEVQNRTDFDYALVHLLEENEEYRNAFLQAKEAGREIFLDNSAFEKGEPAIDLMLKWIPILKPDYYFLPDYWGDKKKTIEESEKFIEEAKRLNLPGKRIGTVKGNSLEELLECYRYFAESEDIDMIALSHKATPEFGEYDRVKILETIEREGLLNYNKPHHLLGCTLPQEMYQCKYLPYIYSCDTSAPVQQPILNNSFHPDGTLDHKEPLVDKTADNYLNLTLGSKLRNEIMETIDQFRELMYVDPKKEFIHSLIHQTWVDGFVKYKTRLIRPYYQQKDMDGVTNKDHLLKHEKDYLEYGHSEDLRHWVFRSVWEGSLRWQTLLDLQNKVTDKDVQNLEHLMELRYYYVRQNESS